MNDGLPEDTSFEFSDNITIKFYWSGIHDRYEGKALITMPHLLVKIWLGPFELIEGDKETVAANRLHRIADAIKEGAG